MAYVRKTQTLVDGIGYKVESMRDAEVKLRGKNKVALEIGTPLYNDVRHAIESAVWSEAPELKDKIPDDWCKHEDVMSATFRPEGENTFNVDVTRVTFETSVGDKLKLPPNVSRWDTIPVNEKYTTQAVRDWVAGRLAIERSQKETYDLFGNIKQQITDFLETHASLNAAVKAMPELELYVPQEYIDKLKEKTVRVKKETVEAPEVNVDVEALTRAAVAHRITSGN